MVELRRNFVNIFEHIDEEELQEDVNDFLRNMEYISAKLIDIKYCVVKDGDRDLVHSAMVIYSETREEKKDEDN